MLSDKDFKRIVVTPNRRAVQMTYRVKEDALYVTVPIRTSDRSILKGVDELRSRLLTKQQKVVRRVVNWDFQLDAPHFKLSVIEGSAAGFQLRVEREQSQILAPPATDFSTEPVQTMLHGAVETALKKSASWFLPSLLKELSIRHTLPYGRVRITTSKGRWGSCSSQHSINLSCYLMLLPRHLIEYVLLHELAHTQELNHSERFWQLLDELTGGCSLAWRNELRKYDTKF